MRLVSCAFIVVCFAAGCPEPNTLTGSISQSHDLTFDEVQLTFLSEQEAYELKYLLSLESGGDDVVAKVVFDKPADGIVAGDELDLLPLNGRVERITSANDPFPAGLDKANVIVTTGAGKDNGEQMVGEFASTFDNGKTLNGTFDVELEVVAF